MSDGFIPPHGGCAGLLSHRKVDAVYDATVYLCNRFLGNRDRTRDQMVRPCVPANRSPSKAASHDFVSSPKSLRSLMSFSSLRRDLSPRVEIWAGCC